MLKATILAVLIFGNCSYFALRRLGPLRIEEEQTSANIKLTTIVSEVEQNPGSPTRSQPIFLPPIREIPEKHWQSWKVDVSDLTRQERDQIRTWREKNPYHRYEVLSDLSAETFVRQAYRDDPEIARIYLSLRDPILRADLLRYLILYAEGGVWSDIDTKALKSVQNWIPSQYDRRVNVVIGVEIDEPDVMWADWADNFALCQSTMMSSAGHPIYQTLIYNIVQTFSEMERNQGTSLSDLNVSFQDVLRITGPLAFTTVVLDYLTETTGGRITRANFSGMTEPKLVADVLVLPVVAFVPGQAHSNSGHPEDEAALVQHLGLGSWRETHLLESEKSKSVNGYKEV